MPSEFVAQYENSPGFEIDPVKPFFGFLCPEDILALVYLLGTIHFCVMYFSSSLVPIIIRAVLIPAILLLRPLIRRRESKTCGCFANTIVSFLPWSIFPIAFWETPTWAHHLHPNDQCDNDASVQSVDQLLFGCQPVAEFRTIFANEHTRLNVAEVLQTSYFLSYVMVALVPMLYFGWKKRLLFGRLLVTMQIIVFFSLGFYYAFPVSGPYVCFEAPLPEDMGYLMARVNAWIQGAWGTSLPNVAVTSAVAFFVFSCMHHGWLAVIIFLPCLGACLGAVYCQYAYGLDVIVSVAMGVICALLGCAIYDGIKRCADMEWTGDDARAANFHISTDDGPEVNERGPMQTSKSFSVWASDDSDDGQQVFIG